MQSIFIQIFFLTLCIVCVFVFWVYPREFNCIGCGACVAQCPNGAAQLFTSAKVSHLGLMPQGQPERYRRVDQMVAQMEEEAFGSCTNHRECEAVCPKEISVDFIARMNRDYLKAKFKRS